MTSLQYAPPRLPDIDDVQPVGPNDQIIFDEVREVLQRHGALLRFGMTLLHQHFDMSDDEVLVESIDVENRTLSSSPQIAKGVKSAIETSWRLDDPTGAKLCETLCRKERDIDGKEYHLGAHYTTK